MAAGALSIKLRCASWQQLATIYRRDLSKGTMFLKASTPPPVGTAVRIDLTLPSASVIVLNGMVAAHVNDAQRGAGVELKLAPIAASSIWMIESALAAAGPLPTATARMVPHQEPSGANAAPQPKDAPAAVPVSLKDVASGAVVMGMSDGDDLAAAETDLVRALVSEAESLKKLNPFLVLGVGYEASDADVRGAFGELTKRYHPDRFARYQSTELRTTAAEIFILIRDAYRRLGDEAGRMAVLSQLGRAAAPRAVAAPRPTGPPPAPRPAPPRPTARTPVGGVPISASTSSVPRAIPEQRSGAVRAVTDHKSGPIRAVLDRAAAPSGAAAGTGPAASDHHSGPVRVPPQVAALPKSGAAKAPSQPLTPIKPPGPPPLPRVIRPPTQVPPPPAKYEQMTSQGEVIATAAEGHSGASTRPVAAGAASGTGGHPAITDASDAGQIEELLDAGHVEEAMAAYRLLSKKHPTDRNFRAGIELCEGLNALAARDRLEAAQRFEAALEIDPSNERAARELADMRRQATNERKGLLSRLMGKKEGSP